MSDFAREIQNFQRYGTYTYKFDSEGNLTFDSGSTDFSRVYLAFPIRNVIYNQTKLESFYDPAFVEFIPEEEPSNEVNQEAIQQQLDTLESENASLKSQLDTLTNDVETSGDAADKLAVKQVILELRKALGQGRVDSDFSDDFPYSPLAKKSSIISETENNNPTNQVGESTSVGQSRSPAGSTTSPSGGSRGPTTPTTPPASIPTEIFNDYVGRVSTGERLGSGGRRPGGQVIHPN